MQASIPRSMRAPEPQRSTVGGGVCGGATARARVLLLGLGVVDEVLACEPRLLLACELHGMY
jgi:hypothetical protein